MDEESPTRGSRFHRDLNVETLLVVPFVAGFIGLVLYQSKGKARAEPQQKPPLDLRRKPEPPPFEIPTSARDFRSEVYPPVMQTWDVLGSFVVHGAL